MVNAGSKTLVSTGRQAARRASRLVGILVAAVLCAGTSVVAQTAEQAQAAEPATITNTCSTGGTTNADSYGYCWFDFTGLNAAGSTGTITQPFTQLIGNSGFKMSFTVTISQHSSSGSLPIWSARATPTWASALFGNPSKNTTTVPGKPTISNQSTSDPEKGFDGGSGDAAIGISGIKLLDPAGQEITSYSLALADAETSNAGETWQWTTDGEPWQVHSLVDPDSDGGACRGPADTTNLAGLTGVGTQTLTCVGSPNSWGALVATTGWSPKQITAVNTETNTGRQALAIGINTASLTFKKTIASRASASDQFGLNITDGWGTQIGPSPVTSGTAKNATTGTLTVPVSSAWYDLRETAAGSASLSNYAQSWTCTSATGKAIGLRPDGSGGINQSVQLPGVDQVACTLVNTALSNRVTLTKQWNGALAGSTATLAISAAGIKNRVGRTSTAGTGPNPDTDNVASGTVTAGTVVTLSETPGGTPADYAQSFSCVQVGTSWTSTGATFTMPSTGGQIDCTVTNSTSAQQVVVNKKWVIKNAAGTVLGTHSIPAQSSDSGGLPAGFSTALTLPGQTDPRFGRTYDGYVNGQNISIGEASVTVPEGCEISSQSVTEVNGTAVTTANAVPYTATLTASPNPNTFTITNTVTCEVSTLTLVKQVGFGSLPATSWTLSGAGPAGALPGPNGVTASTGATAVTVTPGVSYALAETSTTAGSENYVPTSDGWVCATDTEPVPVSGSSVVVGYGQNVTCTITNTTAKITVLKHIEGAGGLTAGQFALTLTPAPGLGSAVTFDGEEAATSTNSFEVKPGSSYSLVEQSLSSTTAYLPLGLQRSTDGGTTWTAVSGNRFTPAAGTTVQYRFVNQAVPALMLPLTGGVGVDVIAYWSIALLMAAAVALIWLVRRRARQA